MNCRGLTWPWGIFVLCCLFCFSICKYSWKSPAYFMSIVWSPVLFYICFVSSLLKCCPKISGLVIRNWDVRSLLTAPKTWEILLLRQLQPCWKFPVCLISLRDWCVLFPASCWDHCVCEPPTSLIPNLLLLTGKYVFVHSDRTGLKHCSRYSQLIEMHFAFYCQYELDWKQTLIQMLKIQLSRKTALSILMHTGDSPDSFCDCSHTEFHPLCSGQCAVEGVVWRQLLLGSALERLLSQHGSHREGDLNNSSLCTD